jgi:hypothetical protein
LNLGGVDGPVDHERDRNDDLYNFKNEFGGVVISQPRGMKTISWLGARLDSSVTLYKRMVTR